jgi:hypothetical protein
MTIKNLSAFTNPSTLRPAINGVLITPKKIVATDSYKLIEERCEVGVTAPVIVRLPKGVKTFASVSPDGKSIVGKRGEVYTTETLKADDFPEYEQVIPKEDALSYVKLSAAHLMEICEAFAHGEKSFTIEVHGPHKPVVFISGNKRALLMPMT